MFSDDEALGRLIGLSASEHPALRLAAVAGCTMLDAQTEGLRGFLESMARDPHPRIAVLAQNVFARHALDQEPEPITGVACPDARKRSVAPPPMPTEA